MLRRIDGGEQSIRDAQLTLIRHSQAIRYRLDDGVGRRHVAAYSFSEIDAAGIPAACTGLTAESGQRP